MNNQDLAKAIGKAIRNAERAAHAEGATNTLDALAILHKRLNTAFSRARALDPSLDWGSVGGFHIEGGGTPKEQP